MIATPAEPTIADLDRIAPDWGILEWDKYIYIPMGVRVAIPNFARGCPFTCSFCSQWKFWRDYRVRDPKKVVDEIETLVRDHQVGFFILADEEPTIHRKKFIAFCEELIARNLPVLWGINTRVTDILRDEKLLPMFRKAGLDPRVARHRGGGAAEARPLQQGNDDRAEQEGDPAAARRRHRHRGAVHRRPRERDAPRRWKRPTGWRATGTRTWPTGRCTRRGRSRDLFQELGDKVEVFDFEKYNFVTPIMKPDAMDRAELLDRVMHNYRRFFMNKTLLPVPVDAGQDAAQVPDGLPEGLREERLRAHVLRPRPRRLLGPAEQEERSTSRFDKHARIERPDAGGDRSADAGWVTMHGPKIEHKRRKGEQIAAPRWPAAAATSSSRETTAGGPARDHGACRAASGPTRSPASPRCSRTSVGDAAHGRDVRLRRAWRLPRRSRRSRWSTKTKRGGLHARAARDARRPAARPRGARGRRGAPPTTCWRTASRGRCKALLRALPAALACRVLLAAIRGMPGPSPAAAASRPSAGRPVRADDPRQPAVPRPAHATRRCATTTPPPSSSLFRVLVHRHARVTEVSCEARGDDACRFDVRW